MIRCKVLLTQGNNSVEITIDKSTGGYLSEGVTQLGKFLSAEGNIPPERKTWVHALAKWELRLIDGGGEGVGMAGGGLKYGELAPLEPSAILSAAWISRRGVEPIGALVGSGMIKKAAEISVHFKNGPVSWRLQSFQREGSNAWINP
jgi:hypothetical protein